MSIERPSVETVQQMSPQSATKGERKGKRAKRGQFPTYVPGKSCIQLGIKGGHQFVSRPKGGRICTRCGSTVSAKSLAMQGKSKKGRKARANSGNGPKVERDSDDSNN